MTIQEFQILALRTLNDLGSKLLNSIHMTSGMSSEFNKELIEALFKRDEVNMHEEYGDIYWFAVCYAHIHKIEIPKYLSPFVNPTEMDNVSWLSVQIGALVDYDKRLLAYKKETDEGSRRDTLLTLLAALENLAPEINVSTEKARTMVIAKLSKRYPAQFSMELANNRDLQAERAILEGGQ